MNPRHLTEPEFKATFTSPMRNATTTATNVIDIWPYTRAIPASDMEGHEICDGLVEAVYGTDDERFDHVLVMTRTKDVYVVVVIDLTGDKIYGHRLLDLNTEYGLKDRG